MAPPVSIRQTPIRQATVHFPKDTVEVDLILAEKLMDEFTASLQASFRDDQLERSTLLSFAERLLRGHDFRWASTIHLHENEVAIDNAPDVAIEEGASICTEGKITGGFFSPPHPILLDGFSALGGTLEFDRITTNEDGHMEVSGLCHPFTKDMTSMVMESPAGSFYSNGRIEPLPIRDALETATRLEPPSDMAGDAFKALLEEMLQDTSFTLAGYAKDCLQEWWSSSREDCQTPSISARVFLNLPLLMETWQTGRHLGFDFSGIEEGSFLEWRQFSLSDLPLPPGVSLSPGTADILCQYNPTSKTTTISLRNLEAQVRLANWFDREPLQISGGLTLTLRPGGEATLHLDGLKFSHSSFPSERFPLFALSGSLNGDLAFHLYPEGPPDLEAAHLDIDSLTLSTTPDRALRFSRQDLNVTSSLLGQVSLDYDARQQEAPLQLQWNLNGSLAGKTPTANFEVGGMQFRGEGEWQLLNGKIIPNLYRLHALFSGDLKGVTRGLTTFEADHLWFSVDGVSENRDATFWTQRANMTFGANEARLGDFACTPLAQMELVSHQTPDTFVIEGDGDWILRAEDPLLELSSDIHFSTELDRVEWSAHTDRDSFVGPFVIRGSGKIEGEGFKKFTLQTEVPFEISKNKTVMAKGITVSGRKDGPNNRIVIDIPSLLNLARARIQFHKFQGSDRFHGNYHLTTRPLPFNREFSLGAIAVSGDFQTPHISEILENPRLFLSGQAQTSIGGILEGPVASNYRSVLRWDSKREALFLSFNPSHSPIVFGPIVSTKENIPHVDAIDGSGNLQGTFVLSEDQHGNFHLTGSRVGLSDGQIFALVDGKVVEERGPDGRMRRVPALANLTFIADRFHGYRNGVIYAGGEGIRFETDVNLGPLQIGLELEDNKRHVTWIADRASASIPGYWRQFKDMVRRGGKAP